MTKDLGTIFIAPFSYLLEKDRQNQCIKPELIRELMEQLPHTVQPLHEHRAPLLVRVGLSLVVPTPLGELVPEGTPFFLYENL